MLAHTGHHLVSALLTPLLPFIRDELVLDYTQAGVLFSAFNISYGLSQLPAGWFADRFGPRLTLTIGVVGVAAAGLLAGLSTTYLMLAGVLVLMGLAGGGYHPSAAPLVSASVEPKNRG
ncbi:MAG: MFS transporter, partial [Dehalococcoidales bacterium]